MPSALREWRGQMPRTTLAPLLGVSKSTLKRWEHGKPPHIMLLLMAITEAHEINGIDAYVRMHVD